MDYARNRPCWARLLGGCMLLASAGCHVLQLFPVGPTPAERENIPGTPGKYSFRLAPYVFLADFEIPRGLPLFRELAALRDQVSKDLKLPPASTPICVYLFEDEERYKR